MYYGLDLHKEFVQVARLSSDGHACQQWQVPTTPEDLEAFAKKLEPQAAVAMETTFNTWQVHHLLKKHFSGRVAVANSLRLKAIASARVKTDKVDARILAQLLRCDFLPEVTLPDQKNWEIRQLIAHRKRLTKQKTAETNGVKALLNHKLLRFPRNLCSPKGQQWLSEQTFTPTEQLMVDHSLKVIRTLEEQLKSADEHLRKLAAWDDSVRLLLTIPGVGLPTAMAVLSMVDDIRRFDSPKKLASYFGLTPRISQSASSCHYGHITKSGDATVRWMLVEAANQMALNGTPLTATYYRIRQKKGHNKAVVALARKLAEIIWHVLTKKEPYRYAPVTAYLKNKLRKVSPGLPQPKQGHAPNDLASLCSYLRLPPPNEGTPAESKSAKKNRAYVVQQRHTYPLDHIVRGEAALKSWKSIKHS